jgi:hypothetical protein
MQPIEAQAAALDAAQRAPLGAVGGGWHWAARRSRRRYLPARLGRARVDLRGIPKGYAGTRQTLEHIAALIRQGAKDFYVRQKAIDILIARGVRPKDYLGEIRALFDWVQRNVRYTKDPYRVEVLHSARRLLELRAGDCDDMTILLAAMLEAIGHPTRLVIVGPDPGQPKLFSHIYLEANLRDRWIPLDPTMPFAMGWAPQALVKEVISIDRRNPKMYPTMDFQGAESAAPTADWLPGLLGALRSEAMPARDPRVKQLYELLRQRGLWEHSQRMQRVLRRIWQRGLQARPRPRLATWMRRTLRRWGLLPRQAGAGAQSAAQQTAGRPLPRVGLRPVQVRRVQPVRVAASPRRGRG